MTRTSQPVTANAAVRGPSPDQYLNCIRCGLCLSVCPTYREHLSEAASPRGRVALARKALEGELDLTRGVLARMYSCFACMACDDACPVGIHPAELALDMRSFQEARHETKWKRALFGGVIGRPQRLEWATLPLRLYEGLGVRRMVYALGLNQQLPARLRDMEAMLPRLPQRPLRRVLPEVSGPRGAAKYRVGFFLGCAQSLMFAQASAATVRVLTRNGCTVVTPKQAACCGMPARGYGRSDLVRQQAMHNIALFEQTGVEAVVTDCATCGSTLKEYGRLLADQPGWAERAQTFSRKVRDVSEFLAQIPLEKPAGRIKARVTYHDPCHLRRGQGIWKQPRDLLRLIDGIEFVESPEADWCCGSAGSQLVTHYATSTGVLDRKIENLQRVSADTIATGCPGCQMQLRAGLRRRGMNAEVVHPVQLFDRAYGEAPVSDGARKRR